MDKDTNMMILCLLLAAMSSPVFGDTWKVTTVKRLETLVSSCVVIPCSFTHPKGDVPSSRLRGIWHLESSRDDRVFAEDTTTIMENFRDRTKMLGHMGQGNCTLEIMNVKDHDNGPFCFRVELEKTNVDMYSFDKDCVNLIMLPTPLEPELTYPKTIYDGVPFPITCTVRHTCPSHAPTLTWNKGTKNWINEIHREVHLGIWEVQSILTYTPEETDDHTDITCTSVFNGGLESSKSTTLYVKRNVNYNHIIIPIVVALGTTVIFAVFCVLMVKKYKARISELQNQDGSMWNRLSRFSRRMRPEHSAPSRTEQRRSIWSRFSRRPKMDMGDQSANQKFSKPRCPSPKSQPKSCNNKQDYDGDNDYMNTVELNIYGNV